MRPLTLPLRYGIFLAILLGSCSIAACAPAAGEPVPATRPAGEGHSGPATTAAATASPEPYPPPTWTLPPVTPFVEPTEEPFPTDAPPPTSVPTPEVTSIPTAAPPIIPLPGGQLPQPFTIVFREGDVLRVMNSDGNEDRLLADIHSQLSLFIAGESLGIQEWGSPAPAGDYLALVLSTATAFSSEQPPVRFSVYLLDLGTGELQLLVEDGTEPVWSPDGRQIAYRNSQTGDLQTVDVATGEVQKLYVADQENEHFVTDIDWHPDSGRLVFLDKASRQSASIVVLDIENAGSPTTLLSSTTHWPYFPKWSPDGSQILFVSLAGESSASDHYNLWVVNADGSQQTQLTKDIDLAAGKPRWSPDGEWIAFTANPSYEDPQQYTDLWLVDKAGINLQRLTAGSSNEWSPEWSPDGTQLLFIRDLEELWSVSLLDGVHTKRPVTISDFILVSGVVER